MARVDFAGQVVRGKVNGVIYSTWKGIHYMKGYAIPRNPKTPAQMENRDKFGNAAKYASSMYKTLYSGFYPEEQKSELYRQILTQCKTIFQTAPESEDDPTVFNEFFQMPFTQSSPFENGFFGLYHKTESPENVNTIWVSTKTNVLNQTFDLNTYYFDADVTTPICYKRPITFAYDESEEYYYAEIDVQMTFTATAINYLRGQVQLSKGNIFYSAFHNYNLYN